MKSKIIRYGIFSIILGSLLYSAILSSCSSIDRSNNSEDQQANIPAEDTTTCYIKIHGLTCPITSCSLGELSTSSQKPDSLLTSHTYQYRTDSSAFTIVINLDYIEPDTKLSWFSEGDSERRWISVALCEWENRLLNKKPRVYIPKTLNWSGDSLCNYYGKRFLKNVDPIQGYASASISIVKRCERFDYATYYYQEIEYLGGAHEMYRYGFATVSKSNSSGMHLSFDDIIKKECQDSVYSMVAHRLKPFILTDVTEDNFARLKIDQIALLPEGVVFFFYPYDVECFAADNIFVIIPYAEMEGMLREGVPIMGPNISRRKRNTLSS